MVGKTPAGMGRGEVFLSDTRKERGKGKASRVGGEYGGIAVEED